MSAPDFMPILSQGKHTDPRNGACLMEYVSILAGEPFSDRPKCTHWLLAHAGRIVNDAAGDDDSQRSKLIPLIPRLVDTRDPSPGYYRLPAQLTISSALQVVDQVNTFQHFNCLSAIAAAQQWVKEPSFVHAESAAQIGKIVLYGAHDNPPSPFYTAHSLYPRDPRFEATLSAGKTALSVSHHISGIRFMCDAVEHALMVYFHDHDSMIDVLESMIREFECVTERPARRQLTDHELAELVTATR